MPKVSFNPQALGTIMTDEDGNVCRIVGESAFVPVVVHGTGVEALYEGLRLANIEGFDTVPRNVSNARDESANNVDPR